MISGYLYNTKNILSDNEYKNHLSNLKSIYSSKWKLSINNTKKLKSWSLYLKNEIKK